MYTKGPWKATNRGQTISIDAPQYIGIAFINPQGNHNSGIPCRAESANARLIAAAPELLAALELIKASFCEDSHLRRYPVIWQMVDNTIAKAKGE